MPCVIRQNILPGIRLEFDPFSASPFEAFLAKNKVDNSRSLFLHIFLSWPNRLTEKV